MIFHPPTTILITGCNGFIGSVFTARLSELGYNVIAIDNKARGLNDVSELPHVSFIERDLQRESVHDLLQRYGPALIVHFAAATGDLTRPQEELEAINVGITENLFRESRLYMDLPSIFLFPMTSLGLAVPESGYVASKQKAIDWLQANDKAERTLLFRFFNNAGGYREFGEFRKQEVHMFPRLFHCWKTGQPFVINGNDYDTADGTPARDYIHVLDAVDWMIYCWGLKRGGRIHEVPTTDGLIEVGRGKSLTTLAIANEFLKQAEALEIPGKPFPIEIGPRRAFDCGSLECKGAAALWKWRPLRSTSDIIKSVLCHSERFCQTYGYPSLQMRE